MSNFFPIKHFNPQKKLGQNFIFSPIFAKSLIKSFAIPKSAHVIEIGPGFGALTTYLFQQTKHLILIEKDQKLHNFLLQIYQNTSKVQLWNENILTFDFNKLPVLKYYVVGNLPYNIATKILQILLFNYHRFRYLYLTFPIKVANRITAIDNKQSYLSIFSKIFCSKIIWLKPISKTVFNPQPKIESYALKFLLRKNPLINPRDFTNFFQFVKLIFQKRRKTLINNLSINDQKAVIFFLQQKKINLKIRAEDLSPKTIIALYFHLNKK